MSKTLLGFAVWVAVLGATAARADHFRHEPDCGPRPSVAPAHYRNTQGRYELQTLQTWVPGQRQQVFVPGQCFPGRRHQRCTQGYYRMVWTPGRYVTAQQWVWVPQPRFPHWPRQQYGYQQPYLPRVASAAIHLASPVGALSVSVR